LDIKLVHFVKNFSKNILLIL